MSTEISYPPVVASFDAKRRLIIESIVRHAASVEGMICILWGGSSVIAQNDLPEFADIDLWLVTEEPVKTKQDLLSQYCELPHLTFMHDAGLLPWFGNLISLFFFPDCSFSVDVGIAGCNDVPFLNCGPAAPSCVFGDFAAVCPELGLPDYSCAPKERIAVIMVNLRKIKKSISRGYLWNAIEYVSRARRELIGLMKDAAGQGRNCHSRPEHSVEDCLPPGDLLALEGTCPSYDSVSIARCTVRISQLALVQIRHHNLSQIWVTAFTQIATDLEVRSIPGER